MEINTAKRGEVIVVSVLDRLDSSNAMRLKEELGSIVGTGGNHIVVNLEKTSFIDSLGLSSLISGYKHARQQGGDLVLAAVPQPIRMVLELTRLHRVFDIYNSQEEAVQSLSQRQNPSG